jgi:hypothetical protein
MAVKIQIRRGAGTVPNLDEGELGFATDTKEVFIGDSTSANVEILTEISRQVLEGQIAGKANTAHDHSIEEVTGLLGVLTDLENGKSNVGHTHTKSDITDFAHTHLKTDITDFAHTHVKEDITDFAHTHAISEITNLQTSLDAKLNTSLKGQANGLAELDATGKIPTAQLPNSAFDSLTFLSTVPLEGTSLGEIASAAVARTLQEGRKSAKALYFVASENITIAETVGEGFTGVLIGDKYYLAYFQTGDTIGSVGQFAPTSSTLEIGDWLLIDNFEGLGTQANPYNVGFVVINNTYEVATDTVHGIVKLFSDTQQSVSSNAVSSTSSRTYGIQNDSDGRLVVNVPWTETIKLNNIVTETQFATLTREAGVVYGAYNETTGIITWYFGDVGV